MSAAISLLVALTLIAPPVDANVAAGEAAYREARWDDASTAFAAAFETTGDPKYLYAQAQVERFAGDCATAVPLYERFLATDPPAQAAGAARRYLAQCRASLPPPTIEPTPQPVPVPADIPAPAPRPRPVGRDPAAIALVGVGGAVAIAGAALVGIAHARADDAPGAADDRAYSDALTRARRLDIAGATLLAAGGALVVGAIVRWSVLAVRARRARTITAR